MDTFSGRSARVREPGIGNSGEPRSVGHARRGSGPATRKTGRFTTASERRADDRRTAGRTAAEPSRPHRPSILRPSTSRAPRRACTDLTRNARCSPALEPGLRSVLRFARRRSAPHPNRNASKRWPTCSPGVLHRGSPPAVFIEPAERLLTEAVPSRTGAPNRISRSPW